MFELLRLNLGIGVTKEDETSVHDFFSKASIKRDCERRLAKYANKPNYKYRIEVKKLKQNIWQASATLKWDNDVRQREKFLYKEQAESIECYRLT